MGDEPTPIHTYSTKRVYHYTQVRRPTIYYIMDSSLSKVCRRCKERKPTFRFCRNKSYSDGITTICKKCERLRQNKARLIAKNYVFPYKGLNDPKYLRDKARTFGKEAKRKREEMGFKW